MRGYFLRSAAAGATAAGAGVGAGGGAGAGAGAGVDACRCWALTLSMLSMRITMRHTAWHMCEGLQSCQQDAYFNYGSRQGHHRAPKAPSGAFQTACVPCMQGVLR